MRMLVGSAQALEQFLTLTDEQVVTRVLAGQTALFELSMHRHNEHRRQRIS